MMGMACVEIHFYIQDFLQLAYFTKVKVQSLLCLICVLINNPDTLLWKGRLYKLKLRKRAFY